MYHETYLCSSDSSEDINKAVLPSLLPCPLTYDDQPINQICEGPRALLFVF